MHETTGATLVTGVMMRREPAAQVVTVEGDLDGATVNDVRHRLHAAVDLGTGDLVVDMSRLDTIDVTGLGVLVGVQRKADRLGRRVVLRQASPRVMRMLASTRLYRVLRIEPAATVG